MGKSGFQAFSRIYKRYPHVSLILYMVTVSFGARITIDLYSVYLTGNEPTLVEVPLSIIFPFIAIIIIVAISLAHIFRKK